MTEDTVLDVEFLKPIYTVDEDNNLFIRARPTGQKLSVSTKEVSPEVTEDDVDAAVQHVRRSIGDWAADLLRAGEDERRQRKGKK